MSFRFIAFRRRVVARKSYAKNVCRPVDLYADIKHKNELGYMLSDSYDLVQEGALYLCENYGKHLNDVLFYNKKGKPITIEKNDEVDKPKNE